MSDAAIDKVRQFESQALSMPQIDIPTSHVIHAGMYARTIMIPAGTILTGALIKIATILIINGNVIAYIGSETIEFTGYNVLPASENRKQAFLAKTDTYLTMIFPTDVDNINDAEEQFTDEADMLISRKTGE
jgi:hypothetical protein